MSVSASRAVPSALLVLAALAAPVGAQLPSPEGSLFFNGPANGGPANGGATPTINSASFLYQPLPPQMQKGLKREDIITVLVDYRSSALSEGEAESRKTGNFAAVLTDWLAFDGKDLFAAPQRRGDPTVGGTVNSQLRAEGEVETRDTLQFRIAAKIVDIRPNGNLVLEAHRDIELNDVVWRTSLTGVVSRESILPDRTVSSDTIVDLQIRKYELGQVRDAYAPGWLNRWWGRVKPF